MAFQPYDKTPASSLQNEDVFIIQRTGLGGSILRVSFELLKQFIGDSSTWAADDYVTGQKVQWNNLQLRATADFTSADPETEIVAGSWEVVGGLFSVNKIENGDVFVVPPNTTCISTELEIDAGGELILLGGSNAGILRAYGGVTNNGTITGSTDQIQSKPL